MSHVAVADLRHAGTANLIHNNLAVVLENYQLPIRVLKLTDVAAIQKHDLILLSHLQNFFYLVELQDSLLTIVLSASLAFFSMLATNNLKSPNERAAGIDNPSSKMKRLSVFPFT
jgi:hypothetical protein